jgi:hypothetical protein
VPYTNLKEIVAMDSAILPAYPHIGISKNHMDMTRFSSRDDQGFLDVTSDLRRWMKQVEKVQGTQHQPIPVIMKRLSGKSTRPQETPC